MINEELMQKQKMKEIIFDAIAQFTQYVRDNKDVKNFQENLVMNWVSNYVDREFK